MADKNGTNQAQSKLTQKCKNTSMSIHKKWASSAKELQHQKIEGSANQHKTHRLITRAKEMHQDAFAERRLFTTIRSSGGMDAHPWSCPRCTCLLEAHI